MLQPGLFLKHKHQQRETVLNVNAFMYQTGFPSLKFNLVMHFFITRYTYTYSVLLLHIILLQNMFFQNNYYKWHASYTTSSITNIPVAVVDSKEHLRSSIIVFRVCFMLHTLGIQCGHRQSTIS